MEDLEGVTNHAGVHVRLGAQAAMVGHTFELPKELPGSFLARAFSDAETIQDAKEEIIK